jgi:hypothetical protein
MSPMRYPDGKATGLRDTVSIMEQSPPPGQGAWYAMAPDSKCAFHVQRRSDSNRSPAWPESQLNEFFVKQATAQQLSTHQHQLEDAIPALSETKRAGGGQ